MPPYHTVEVNSPSDSKITIYLDVEMDQHPTNKSNFYPFEKLAVQIAEDGLPIATDMKLKLLLVPGEHTEMPDKEVMSIEIVHEDQATSNDRIIYREFDKTTDPPAGIEYFNLKVGNGTNADPKTRSTQISYVEYAKHKGYIYVIRDSVPHISHELGHILGLADRYYEGMTWYNDSAIQRNCVQIRTGTWFDEQDEDQRYKVPGKTSQTIKLPRYAERLTLAMHQDAIPADSLYEPSNNLMSSSSPKLTSYQLEFIGIKSGQAVSPTEEPDVRTTRWVAILGAADFGGLGNPEMEAFHVWDGGDGLLFYPGNDKAKPAETYPCYSPDKGKGKDSRGIVGPELLRKAMKKKRVFKLLKAETKKFQNTPGDELGLFDRDIWCYCVRMLKDLE
jgi:hypothetical protein